MGDRGFQIVDFILRGLQTSFSIIREYQAFICCLFISIFNLREIGPTELFKYTQMLVACINLDLDLLLISIFASREC